jgi:hypothetical protein
MEPKSQSEVLDLDTVLISAATWCAWDAVVRRSLPQFRGLDPRDIPDEQGRIASDGSLTIFVALPGGREIALNVPPGEWIRR